MQERGLREYADIRGLSLKPRDLLLVGFRHPRLILLSFFGIFLGTVLAALLLPKTYEAEMKILVRSERVDPAVTPQPTNNALQQLAPGVTEEELNSELELIKSQDLLQKVVLACDLDRQPSFWASLFPSKKEDEADPAAVPRAVRTLGKNLRVEVVKKTNIIAVTYPSHDPKLAANVLNALTKLYLEKHVEVFRPTGATDFFQQQAEQYRKRLAYAELRLANFNRDQGAASAPLHRDLSVQKLTDFEATLEQTQASIEATQRRIHDIEAQMSVTPPRLTTTERNNSHLLEQLKSSLLPLELSRTALLKNFKPEYRPLQELEAQLSQTRAAIEAEEKAPVRESTTDWNPVYQWLNGELAKAKADLASLRATAEATDRSVQAYREKARSIDRKEITQEDLIRTVKAEEANYLLYLNKQEEARISDALDQRRILNVAVAEAATVPFLPTNPPRLIVLLGTVLALLVSLGLALAAEHWDPSFRTPDELEDFLEVPVLASIPKNGH